VNIPPAADETDLIQPSEVIGSDVTGQSSQIPLRHQISSPSGSSLLSSGQRQPSEVIGSDVTGQSSQIPLRHQISSPSGSSLLSSGQRILLILFKKFNKLANCYCTEVK